MSNNERLEYLRGELRAERISQGELIELASLREDIPAGDVELLEAAGVPEHEAEGEARAVVAAESAADIVRAEVVNRGTRFEEDGLDGGGIYAYAEIHFATRCGGWYIGPTLRTPGVWEIEGDDAREFAHREYAEDEIELLDEMLSALGVKPR